MSHQKKINLNNVFYLFKRNQNICSTIAQRVSLGIVYYPTNDVKIVFNTNGKTKCHHLTLLSFIKEDQYNIRGVAEDVAFGFLVAVPSVGE